MTGLEVGRAESGEKKREIRGDLEDCALNSKANDDKSLLFKN